MDWSNEEYVRVYTRDTDDWIALSWEAQSLFVLLLRKLTRAGKLVTRRGSAGIAGVTRIPIEVVSRALPELLSDGCVQETSDGYVVPNFLEANEATKSDRLRKREERARIRDNAVHDASVTKRDRQSQNVTRESQNVTDSHEQSRAVTGSHALSQNVTLTSADPDPIPNPDPDTSGKPEAVSLALISDSESEPRQSPAEALAAKAVAEINRLARRPKGFDVGAIETVKLCRALVRERIPESDVLDVIRFKAAEWAGGKMAPRICPGTLLALSNVRRYLDEMRAGPPAGTVATGGGMSVETEVPMGVRTMRGADGKLYRLDADFRPVPFEEKAS